MHTFKNFTVETICIYVKLTPTHMVRNSTETEHAQTEDKESSTSGRGARASYQTMSPEISARGSLL